MGEPAPARRGTRNEAERALLRQLRQLREVAQLRPGYAYRNAADFVLRHGAWYEPGPLPAKMRRGAPKMCYGNAITLAATGNLSYVEGFALLPEPFAQIAICHAWVTDGGRAIDSTWPIVGACYLGVEFSAERAHDATWNGDACILDDWHRRWPIFRTPWQGEPEGLVWEGTEVVAMLRRGDLESAGQWLDEHIGELG